MNTICLVLDRLHSGYLGPYGNTWVQTPAFNRLACESFTFDQMSIDAPDLERLYRSYWHGWHALCPHEPPPERRSLIAALRESGVTAALMSDERRVLEHPLAVDFDEFIAIDPPWQPQVAADIEQTHLANCFAELIDWLPSAREPFFLWCHLASLGTAWDAPLNFREIYRDEDDPELPASAEVPDRFLPENFDPDELLGVSQSYAGQISLLDGCLDALLEELDSIPAGKETLLVVTSPRGFPLGEHRRIGPCDRALYGELLHVPLFVRFPDRAHAAARTQSLVEPADLWASLWQYLKIGELPHSPTALSWLPIAGQDPSASRHDRLCMAGEKGERAIRTTAWFLRAAGEGELYVKPDDRFEVNNVANRCLEIVENLQEARVQYEQTLHSGSLGDLPPLEEVLLHGL
ncbi:MAG: sulfatase-like hydrolase/transferase [Pirellulales bacterium]|nr:sulfatase-like hydrolase/transferase [Pirellulales bacterium]